MNIDKYNEVWTQEVPSWRYILAWNERHFQGRSQRSQPQLFRLSTYSTNKKWTKYEICYTMLSDIVMLYDVISYDVVCCLHVGLSPLHCDPIDFNSCVCTKRQLQLLPAFGALIDLVGVWEGQCDLVSGLQPAHSFETACTIFATLLGPCQHWKHVNIQNQ